MNVKRKAMPLKAVVARIGSAAMLRFSGSKAVRVRRGLLAWLLA